VSRVHSLMKKFPCLQELPPTEHIDQDDEGEWDTVGEAAGSRSPAPTVEELLALWSASPLLLRKAQSPLLLRKRLGRRGSGGGARRCWTGGHRQHPRRPDRDGGLVKLVSVGSSRVVLGVVVVLD
jgi:hypothetical protein